MPQNPAKNVTVLRRQMKGKSPDSSQLNLLPQRLEDLVNPGHPLCKLSKRIPWDETEEYFSDLYHHSGRPPTQIR